MSDSELDNSVLDCPDSKKNSTAEQDEWTTETTNTLIHNVMSQIVPGEVTPYQARIIDWNKVSWDDYNPEKCLKKWEELLAKVRHYRTLFEVATDMIGFLDRKKSNSKVTQWNRELIKQNRQIKNVEKTPGTSRSFRRHLAKKQREEDAVAGYPPKPKSSAYSLFCTEKLKELKDSLHGKQLMVTVGKMWAELSPQKKQKYHDTWEKEKSIYITKLKEHEMNHPDDKRVKELISEAGTTKNGTKNRKKSSTQSASLDSKSAEKSSDQEEMNSLMDTFESDYQYEAGSRANKSSPTKSPDQSLMESETETTISKSPVKTPKKRPNDSGDAPDAEETPRKKKHKHKIRGEDVYIEEKKESYRIEHPDLEPEEIVAKLKRKYAKLSEKKTKKYERLAAETNK